ncbi:sporulation protein YqfD [Alteribacillus iranensis]|uniref:Similar to stage IV sporulation protein n=1 Tax=Alteribacillus iranensis TaxID=930128 RepID=A0A1I1ZF33_9BACI|nr:sporulation protein YqfD [Alteribacillus iranensis]SFE28940.1 similar to stage IV sporulation protein [Alteribacillus iranensis]
MNKKRGPSDVMIRITGNAIETCLNECLKDGVMLKNIIRQDPFTATLYIASTDTSQVRELANDYECHIEVIRDSLFERYIRMLKKRAGFFVGAALFCCLLIVLSQMVWKVEVQGANPEIERTITENLEKLGLKPGAFQITLPPPEMIQKEILDHTNGVTWVGVDKKGTAYYLNVAEQTLPEKESQPPPRHITAKKKAVIHSVYAEKGQAVVKRNDLVHEGDMLISGFIGKGKYAKAVPATGEILGETWYKVVVEVPMKRKVTTLTGAYEKQHVLYIFGLKLPVWGFTAADAFQNFHVEEDLRQISWRDYQLPLAWLTKTYEKVNEVPIDLSVEEGLEEAKEVARFKMNSHLSGEAYIDEEKILHSESRDGKVKLEMHYQVIEDITSEAPIIQGEMKE